MRRLELLLVVWVILVIVPGVVATLAFDLHASSTLGGREMAIWLPAFVLQIIVMIALSRITGKQLILPFLVASLLPFGTDFGMPVHRWIVAPCIVIALVTAWLIYRSAHVSAVMQAQGIPATGTVVAVVRPLFNVVINNVYIRRTLKLRVERGDGAAPYEVQYHGLFMLGEIPDPGDRLALRVDPKKPNHVVAESGVAAKGRADSVALPPPSSFRMHHVPTHQLTDTKPQLADELDKLVRLHASGGLSDAEFAQAKARILGG